MKDRPDIWHRDPMVLERAELPHTGDYIDLRLSRHRLLSIRGWCPIYKTVIRIMGFHKVKDVKRHSMEEN